MTIDQILFAGFGVLLGVAADRLLDYMRGKDNILSLQRDNTALTNENSRLRQQLADRLKADQERIATENDRENYHRDQQELSVLTMLATEHGKTVNQIAAHLGIGHELVLKHLISLSRDHLVHSTNYSDDNDWNDGCEPYESTWHIRPLGRDYLARNGQLP